MKKILFFISICFCVNSVYADSHKIPSLTSRGQKVIVSDETPKGCRTVGEVEAIDYKKNGEPTVSFNTLSKGAINNLKNEAAKKTTANRPVIKIIETGYVCGKIKSTQQGYECSYNQAISGKNKLFAVAYKAIVFNCN